MVEQLRRRYDSESARRYLNAYNSGLFEQAVRTAWELYERTGDSQFLRKSLFAVRKK